jgi:hypothetical protein
MSENNTSRIGEQALPFDVPGWINWIAQDESGVWWGYTVEPLRNDRGWYENEVGDYIRLGVTVPNNWVDSLRRVNNGS